MNTRQETNTPAETPEELIEHISRLMAEAEAMLAGPVTEQVPGRLAEIKERLQDARAQLTDIYGRARRNVIAGARYTDETIRNNPYYSMAIALSLGVLVGVLLQRTMRTRESTG